MKQHITAAQIKEIPDYLIMRIFVDADSDSESDPKLELKDEHYSVFSKWMTIGKMMDMLEDTPTGRLVLSIVLTKYNHILTTGTYNENFDLCDELWRDVRLTL